MPFDNVECDTRAYSCGVEHTRVGFGDRTQPPGRVVPSASGTTPRQVWVCDGDGFAEISTDPLRTPARPLPNAVAQAGRVAPPRPDAAQGEPAVGWRSRVSIRGRRLRHWRLATSALGGRGWTGCGARRPCLRAELPGNRTRGIA